MFLLAAIIAVLSGHVYVGWIRQSQLAPLLRGRLVGLGWAALSFGTSLTLFILLSMAAEPMRFPLSYRWYVVLLLWLGAMAGACIPVIWLQWRQNWTALIGSALCIAALAGSLQFGWLKLAGFRPGIVWSGTGIAVATAVEIVGIIISVWIAFGGDRDERKGAAWRLGGGGALALALIAGQHLLLVNVNLIAQSGTMFRDAMSVRWVFLAGGVLAPLLLSAMVIDLEMRARYSANRSTRPPSPPGQRRRKRKLRVQVL